MWRTSYRLIFSYYWIWSRNINSQQILLKWHTRCFCASSRRLFLKAYIHHTLLVQTNHIHRRNVMHKMRMGMLYSPTASNSISILYQHHHSCLTQVLYAPWWTPAEDRRMQQGHCWEKSSRGRHPCVSVIPPSSMRREKAGENHGQATWTSCRATWTCAVVPFISTVISSGNPLVSWTVITAPLVRLMYAILPPPIPIISSAYVSGICIFCVTCIGKSDQNIVQQYSKYKTGSIRWFLKQ